MGLPKDYHLSKRFYDAAAEKSTEGMPRDIENAISDSWFAILQFLIADFLKISILSNIYY